MAKVNSKSWDSIDGAVAQEATRLSEKFNLDSSSVLKILKRTLVADVSPQDTTESVDLIFFPNLEEALNQLPAEVAFTLFDNDRLHEDIQLFNSISRSPILLTHELGKAFQLLLAAISSDKSTVSKNGHLSNPVHMIPIPDLNLNLLYPDVHSESGKSFFADHLSVKEVQWIMAARPSLNAKKESILKLFESALRKADSKNLIEMTIAELINGIKPTELSLLNRLDVLYIENTTNISDGFPGGAGGIADLVNAAGYITLAIDRRSEIAALRKILSGLVNLDELNAISLSTKDYWQMCLNPELHGAFNLSIAPFSEFMNAHKLFWSQFGELADGFFATHSPVQSYIRDVADHAIKHFDLYGTAPASVTSDSRSLRSQLSASDGKEFGFIDLPGFKGSPSFRSITCQGQDFNLTSDQARVVELLYRAWSIGNPYMHTEELAPKSEISEFRLDKLFKDVPNWKNLILKHPDKRAVWRLNIQPSAEPKKS